MHASTVVSNGKINVALFYCYMYVVVHMDPAERSSHTRARSNTVCPRECSQYRTRKSKHSARRERLDTTHERENYLAFQCDKSSRLPW